jgi:hypothetical protein
MPARKRLTLTARNQNKFARIRWPPIRLTNLLNLSIGP